MLGRPFSAPMARLPLGLRIRETSALGIPVIAATPEMLTRLLFSSCRAATLSTAAVLNIKFISRMLNPQSKTKADRGFNNFISDFRAASWIATALDIFERRAKARRDV